MIEMNYNFFLFFIVLFPNACYFVALVACVMFIVNKQTNNIIFRSLLGMQTYSIYVLDITMLILTEYIIRALPVLFEPPQACFC